MDRIRHYLEQPADWFYAAHDGLLRLACSSVCHCRKRIRLHGDRRDAGSTRLAEWNCGEQWSCSPADKWVVSVGELCQQGRPNHKPRSAVEYRAVREWPGGPARRNRSHRPARAAGSDWRNGPRLQLPRSAGCGDQLQPVRCRHLRRAELPGHHCLRYTGRPEQL